MLALGMVLALVATASAEAAPAEAAPPAPAPANADARPSLEFRQFDDKAFLAARRGTAPIVLYFEADWCVPCKEMHATTFREPAVLEAAAGMELFRVDMSRPDVHVDLIKKSFQVEGAPTLIVFAPGGREAARRFGFIPPDVLATMLAKAREPRRPPASS